MNKGIRYFFIVVICVTAIMLGVTSCSKKSSGNEALKVFHYLDRADDVAVSNFELVTERFEQLYPDISLEFDFLVNEPYHNKLQAMNIANQLPDLMYLYPMKRTGQVTGSGKIKDLRPWLEPHMDEFAPAALVPQGPNGEIYELPEQITATHIMYTNDTLLTELGLTFPKTLEELVAQGTIISNAGYIPIAMDNKDGWEMQSLLLSALVERTGGRAWVEAARKGDASFSDQAFVDALQVIKTLNDAQMFSPGVNQAEYGRALTDFVNGRAVYLIDGGWRVSAIIGEASEELQQNISFNVFPTLPNEKGQPKSSATIAGTGFGMHATLEGEAADAAWKWIWFYSGPEGGSIKIQQGFLPAYKMDLPDDTPLLTKKLAAFLGSTPGGYVIDGIMDAEGMSVLHTNIQEMMFGNMSPSDAAASYEAWVAANDSGRK